MSGHRHLNDPTLSQNQGNVLGSRPCVRQSRIYREQCGGNTMKELLGQEELKWNTTTTEGCYAGGSVYDHNTDDHRAHRDNAGRTTTTTTTAAAAAAAPAPRDAPASSQQQQQQPLPSSSSSSAGHVNDGTTPPPRSAISTGRGFRPGAGQANKQTYNIFTGQ